MDHREFEQTQICENTDLAVSHFLEKIHTGTQAHADKDKSRHIPKFSSQAEEQYDLKVAGILPLNFLEVIRCNQKHRLTSTVSQCSLSMGKYHLTLDPQSKAHPKCVFCLHL